MFIFNVAISSKENISNIISFQYIANDAVGFRLSQGEKEANPKLLFVVIFVCFKFDFYIQFHFRSFYDSFIHVYLVLTVCLP
jgi:hypothetical protein